MVSVRPRRHVVLTLTLTLLSVSPSLEPAANPTPRQRRRQAAHLRTRLLDILQTHPLDTPRTPRTQLPTASRPLPLPRQPPPRPQTLPQSLTRLHPPRTSTLQIRLPRTLILQTNLPRIRHAVALPSQLQPTKTIRTNLILENTGLKGPKQDIPPLHSSPDRRVNFVGALSASTSYSETRGTVTSIFSSCPIRGNFPTSALEKAVQVYNRGSCKMEYSIGNSLGWLVTRVRFYTCKVFPRLAKLCCGGSLDIRRYLGMFMSMAIVVLASF